MYIVYVNVFVSNISHISQRQWKIQVKNENSKRMGLVEKDSDAYYIGRVVGR